MSFYKDMAWDLGEGLVSETLVCQEILQRLLEICRDGAVLYSLAS